MRVIAATVLGLALLHPVPAADTASAARDGGILSAAPATEWSSASRRKRVKRPRARQYRSPARIACTRAGCGPVPPGCTAAPERNWDGIPTGFEMIVCPGR
jgi:hypothetical protein